MDALRKGAARSAVVETLYSMPASFAAGTTVAYTKGFSDFPANDGWVLTVFVNGKNVLSKQAGTSGADFVVTLLPTDTDDLGAGTYRWTERVTKGTEAHDVANGVVVVTPNVATATAGQLQSHAEKMIAAIEAVLEGRVIPGQDKEKWTIGGRAIELIPWAELRRELAKYRAELAAIRNPGAFGKKILVTFNGTGFDR